MRIGQFGKENDLSIDTIRHYMDLGLIIPEKKGGQYHFDDRCQQDLNLILECKSMGFSLNEVKVILYYKNFGKLTDYEKDSYYLSLFLDKYREIQEEITNLQDIHKKLKDKLNQLSLNANDPYRVTGMDLRCLSMLKCPSCNKSLTLQDGKINQNQIIEGQLTCECGQSYRIESGILIVDKANMSNQLCDSNEMIYDYIHETDSEYLASLYKGLHWMKKKLTQVDLDQKVLLELGSGYGFFLRNIFQDLPKDCLYIAVDHNIDQLKFLKSLFDRTNSKGNMLFICADFLSIPLQDHTVDFVIDLTGTSNYCFRHEDFLLHEVDSLAKQDAYLLGGYFIFKNFSGKSKIPLNFRKNFIEKNIKEEIGQLNYSPLDEILSDPIRKGGKYEDFFVQGETIFSYTVFAKR